MDLQLNNDTRRNNLSAWLSEVLGADISSLEPASEDASFRRYFRLFRDHRSYVVMDAPPENEDTEPFVKIARRFLKFGLNVPEIHAVNSNQGFVLLTDLGSTTYLNALNQENVDQLYGDAIDSLINLQAATATEPKFLPPYDASLLCFEMELFRKWYVTEHLRLKLTRQHDEMLTESFDFLKNKALEQPKVWVHRDYHSRNLMLVPNNNPGILDFQDAVYGPVTYDLVSLLRDCYISWSDEQIDAWIKLYRSRAMNAGLDVGCNKTEFDEWFDWMGVQRHLKATGIFARLHHRDGKSNFLNDIPNVLAYIETVCTKYPQLYGLGRFVTGLRSVS